MSSSPLALSRTGSSPAASSDVPVTRAQRGFRVPQQPAGERTCIARVDAGPTTSPLNGNTPFGSPLRFERGARGRHAGQLCSEGAAPPYSRSATRRFRDSDGRAAARRRGRARDHLGDERERAGDAAGDIHDFFNEFVDLERPTDGALLPRLPRAPPREDGVRSTSTARSIKSFDASGCTRARQLPRRDDPDRVCGGAATCTCASSPARRTGRQASRRAPSTWRRTRCATSTRWTSTSSASAAWSRGRRACDPRPVGGSSSPARCCGTPRPRSTARRDRRAAALHQHGSARRSRRCSLVHNRSKFTRQAARAHPGGAEHIPEGETPQTVSMCTWDQLVDVAKPGDRVEVTGIFRAMPVRVNPRHRTFRSIYKTYVDMIHVRKLDKGRRLQLDSADGVDSHRDRPSTNEFKARRRAALRRPVASRGRARALSGRAEGRPGGARTGPVWGFGGGGGEARWGAPHRSEPPPPLAQDSEPPAPGPESRKRELVPLSKPPEPVRAARRRASRRRCGSSTT